VEEERDDRTGRRWQVEREELELVRERVAQLDRWQTVVGEGAEPHCCRRTEPGEGNEGHKHRGEEQGEEHGRQPVRHSTPPAGHRSTVLVAWNLALAAVHPESEEREDETAVEHRVDGGEGRAVVRAERVQKTLRTELAGAYRVVQSVEREVEEGEEEPHQCCQREPEPDTAAPERPRRDREERAVTEEQGGEDTEVEPQFRVVFAEGAPEIKERRGAEQCSQEREPECDTLAQGLRGWGSVAVGWARHRRVPTA
jgi:hypothetical protein